MIKNFEEYINEDYFSKLANRKDTGNVRMENEITEDFVRSFILKGYGDYIRSITIRKKNGKTVVDVDGDLVLDTDIKDIPFQFGKVTGSIDLVECNNLVSLEGCPQEIGGEFDCNGCEKLTSLEGCPEIVDGDFSCSGCENLTSLEGCPKEVGGDFYCSHCGKKFTESEVKSLCNVKGEILV